MKTMGAFITKNSLNRTLKIITLSVITLTLTSSIFTACDRKQEVGTDDKKEPHKTEAPPVKESAAPKPTPAKYSENTQRLMKYLEDMYGKAIISGQQIAPWSPYEIPIIEKATGKTPAILGLDLIDYSPSRVARGTKGTEVEKAIEWWESNGIVTFCWHWNAPMDLIDSSDQPWDKGFYTKATTFDVKKAMEDINSPEYKAIIADIDAIAVQLKRLQAAEVPVLWRPLHEASGKWFWWGAKGYEPFKKLWLLMYERLANYHELDNLIWVWNGQAGAWYPGDDFVDIIGEDIYANKRNYSSQIDRFKMASMYTKANKMIALTENGIIPDPDLLIKDGAKWSWFCTWNGFLANNNGVLSEENTETEMLKKVYNHSYVITKDELPKLK
jgi:mannan endo-1,4-beta-mannosidase